ncbi:MAG: hypothetical protein KC425_14740, partial [Anaerolineales bacterium]|nr:hypothetical protein [Anaerolineales bacterium]
MSELSEYFYIAAVEQLERLIQDEELGGNFAYAKELRADLDQLRAWLDSGRKGDCPVDLAKYDIATPQQEAQGATVVPASVDTTPFDAEPSAGRASESPIDLALDQDTAEQRHTQRLLDQMEAHVNAGELLSARGIAELARSELEDSDNADVVGRYEALNTRLSNITRLRLYELRNDAQEAYRREEVEAAITLLEEAVQLAPEDAGLRGELLDLRPSLRELSEVRTRQLRRQLLEELNVAELRLGVEDARAYAAAGQLPDELSQLLPDAEMRLNDLRQAHGELTTLMRYGDLEGRKQARDRLERRAAEGEKTIYDPATNADQPIALMLDQANRLYMEESFELAGYEIAQIKANLETPELADQRLRHALEKPFIEDHRRQLQELDTEIRRSLEKKQRATDHLANADAAPNSLACLRHLLLAHAAFPAYPDLAEKLRQAQRSAAAQISQLVETELAAARIALDDDAYEPARTSLQTAGTALASWPEETLAESLQPKQRAVEALAAAVEERARLRRTFDQEVALIRQRLQDADLRAAGLSDLERLRSNAHYRETFSAELERVNSEFDRYRGVSEKLGEARMARSERNWVRVHKLVSELQGSGEAGQMRQEIDELVAEATLELGIGHVRHLVSQDDYEGAQEQASMLQRDFPQKQEEIQARLTQELQQIAAAEEKTAASRFLFQEAQQLAGQRVLDARISALRRFRYLALDATEPGQSDWPAVAPTFFTVRARLAVRELTDRLADENLGPILKAFQNRQAADHTQSVESLHALADHARQLHEGRVVASA